MTSTSGGMSLQDLMMKRKVASFKSTHEPEVEADNLLEELEMEMPGSSFTVGPDDSDLMQLLGESESIPIDNYEPQQSRDTDLVELYSTIAFLKRENQDLMKELELSKVSKEASLKEMQKKFDFQIDSLRNELKEARSLQQLSESASRDQGVLQEQIENLKSELNRVQSEKESLESSLGRSREDRGEIMTAKAEINKLKMEMSRLRSDYESASAESRDLIEQLRSKDDQLKQQQQDTRRLEEQNNTFNADILEKTQMMSRMNEDIFNLDRNLKLSMNQNAELKQRLSILDMAERDLAQAKYRISSIEMENHDLHNQITYLRSHAQQQQASNNLSSYSPPMPPQARAPAPPQPPSSSSSSYNGNGSIGNIMPAANLHAKYHLTTPDPAPYVPQSSSTAASNNNYASSYKSSSSYQQQSQQPSRSSAYGSIDQSASGKGYELDDSGGLIRNSRSAAKSLSSTLGDLTEVRRSFQQQQQQDGGSSAQHQTVGKGGNDSSSLANLLQSRGKGNNYNDGYDNNRALPVRRSNDTPFATEQSATQLMAAFDDMERDLTLCMTEKTSLQEESERLHQRGLKTLRDRSRLQQVESRLGELSKDISNLRLRLTSKPG